MMEKCESSGAISAKVLFIEPFYGGSHKLLIDTLATKFTNHEIVSLPAKKWHWRARCGASMLYDKIPKITSEKILFCSSVLNLAELLGLRADLQPLIKVVYFHENQLVYPVREIKDRDIQYSYNQITTCLAADIVFFNSVFNKVSFLRNIKKIVKIIPDWNPKELESRIEKKCEVLYFPMDFPQISDCVRSTSVLHIVWPHRWEFDKGPDDFFAVLFKLKENKYSFEVSVLGEQFTDNPCVFLQARDALDEEIANFGFVENKSGYYKILTSAHVVISTAKHEFFGVSMLESVYCGCFPLAPNSLVYPEFYPPQCLYNNLDELYEKLREFCTNPSLAVDRRRELDINFDRFSVDSFLSNFARSLKT